MDLERIELSIDTDDEFGADYEDPGRLRAEDVEGTVVYTLDWSVSTVVEQIDSDPADPNSSGMLVTSPPFQRRTAWDASRQSLFIESLMLKLPVPPIVIAESVKSAGQFYVLDGKQRLTSLKKFMKDEADPLRLKGLQLLETELSGMTYAEIRSSATLRKYTQSMLNQPIRTIVVRNWRTPALLHLIFSRLNKASVPLASHELRQAMFPGKFTTYINSRSSASTQLLQARRLKEPDFRLRDAETLLRYIATKTNLSKYRGDLRDFLDRALKGGNDHFEEIDTSLENTVLAMEEAIDATFELFGPAAFLRYDGATAKYMPRFNVSVFELMTWYLSNPEVRKKALDAGEEVVRAFERLCLEDQTFAGYLTATTKTTAAVSGRLKLWGDVLGETLQEQLTPNDFVEAYLPFAAAVNR